MKNNRVVVAMSGGVDSSVAAALLVAQGYEVVGITMRLWDAPDGEESGCCSPEDIQDARAVAARLGIPFYVVNFRGAFQEHVVGYFVGSYLKGSTPNPCIECNRKLKFDLLLRRARELGASFLATGHYARVQWDPITGRYRLLRARDLARDQSYFLFTITQEQLARSLFPLGEMTKTEVRGVAREMGFSVAEKPDSQEVCFVGHGNYVNFIESLGTDGRHGEGEIVDRSGQVLGTHQGLYHYTVGQRRGLGLNGRERYYVAGIDPLRNRVVVGPERELYSGGLIAQGVNWVSGVVPQEPLEARVMIRYRHPGVNASLSVEPGEGVLARFDEPQRAIAAGQAAAFYRDEELLGGGWIVAGLPPGDLL